MRTIILSLFVFGVSSSLPAQELILYSGEKVKSLPYSSIFEIGLGEPADKQDDCCRTTTLEGNLLELKGDSLKMGVDNYMFRNRGGAFVPHSPFISWIEEDQIRFSIDDIYYMRKYRSERNRKRLKRISSIGSTLFFAGLTTAVTGLYLTDHKSKNAMLITGACEISVGLTLGIIGHPKVYKFKNANRLWRIEHD